MALSGALAVAAEAPSEADLVLVVDDAAGLRRSSVGAAATRFLLDAAGVKPTRQAWSTLASQLGWSEIETFDRLLGTRVVLVATGLESPESARWALLSEVSLETDQRLKERLEASQRAIDKGHQILSIEKGRYELTSHRHAPARGADSSARAVKPSDRVTLILGPAGRSELFDRMVGVISSGAARPLAGSDVIAAAASASAGESEILLLTRLGALGAPAAAPGVDDADRWSSFMVVAGGRSRQCAAPLDPSREPCEITARVIHRDRTRSDLAAAVTPTSDSVFRALEPGSLLTIVQAAPVQEVLGDAARLLDTLRDVPLPEPAMRLLASRQIISLRPAETPGGADLPPPLSAMLAIETNSTSELAPYVDGAIARFIASTEQQLGLLRPPPRDFGGRLPGVTRVLPLDLPEGTPLRLLAPDPLVVTWSFPSAPAADAGAARSRPGWWLLGLSAAPPGLESLPEQTHNQAAFRLSNAAASARGEVRPWVWLAALRPSELEKRLPGPLLLPDIGGFRSAMKRFEHLRIALSISGAGDIQGDLSLRLADLPVDRGPGSPH